MYSASKETKKTLYAFTISFLSYLQILSSSLALWTDRARVARRATQSAKVDLVTLSARFTLDTPSIGLATIGLKEDARAMPTVALSEDVLAKVVFARAASPALPGTAMAAALSTILA
jgi:hypothetical protein